MDYGFWIYVHRANVEQSAVFMSFNLKIESDPMSTV
jgi:hypothetical protein